MAISLEVEIQEAQLWPQGDARDPLGTWGFRLGVTGDASGGSTKVTAVVASEKRGAYVYTCYGLTFAQLTGAGTTQGCKYRLLTNWPNIDPIPGIQGYGHLRIPPVVTDPQFTAPLSGWQGTMDQTLERFILLFTETGTPLGLVEIELGVNIDLATFSFEGYGYYWDRLVLQAPGGLRHPGSS